MAGWYFVAAFHNLQVPQIIYQFIDFTNTHTTGRNV
jgi:hypothetical protein